MNNNKRKSLAYSCAMLATAGVSTVSIAQENDFRALEEIVVTATRREQSIQDIPVSITAISATALEDRGITNFADISQVAAGVHLAALSNLTDTSVKIRGVGSQGQGSGVPSVGVFVDGVYQLRDGAAFSEMMDVERVEVLRGPQGTLFGKNSTAGAILVHTKDPDTSDFESRIQAVAGNLDNREVRGMVNVPLIEDVLGMRISAYSAERDGYTENVFVNEDTRNMDRQGGRIKLLWNITDDLYVNFKAETFEQSSRMDGALVSYGPDLDDQQPLPPIGVGKAQQQASEVSDEVDRVVATVGWDFANHSIKSLSSYEKAGTYQFVDFDSTVLESGVTFIENENETESLTEEIQLLSDWGGPFNYVVGLFWQNEKLESNTVLHLEGGDLLPRPPSSRDITSQAIFLNGNYDINEDLKFVAGIRYSDDEVAGTNMVFPGPNLSFEEVTYSFKLQWQVSEDAMVYAAYDKGFKDGGINREFSACGRGGRCLDESEALWDAEYSFNHELGFKTNWFDHRMMFNGAIFYQNYEDFQVTTSIPGEANVLITNAAEVDSIGIEMDIQFALTSAITLDASIAYIITEYGKYENAPCTFEGCPEDGVQDLTGETLDIAPEFTSNIGLDYRAPVEALGGLELFSRLDVSYRTEHNLYSSLSPNTEQDAYAITNLRIGVEQPNSWKVTLWGNNIADEEYGITAEDSLTGLSYVPGLSRTFGITADVFF